MGLEVVGRRGTTYTTLPRCHNTDPHATFSQRPGQEFLVIDAGVRVESPRWLWFPLHFL
ncbi:hypothetical protein E2C01_098531 [Portunus trituberculatus]|uniref:Uncharacterized protein n=1 Tax=Portunus trituberculatus TaxID=210409 RepID=A0A5B7JY21_PORTR|nr:hypothetical protein [Portunus trituberculatus]